MPPGLGTDSIVPQLTYGTRGVLYGIWRLKTTKTGSRRQAWVQSYTPTSSAADYVIHDQQGTPLGYVQRGTA